MNTNLKPLNEQTMVITGASSGIGLATARAAGRQGAKLVLVARNEDVLANVTREINAEGGHAIAVPADVARREELQVAADAARESFGGFDTWVNDAGVGLYATLEEGSDEDHRRLFETNFWGTAYGSLIAVEHLKQRGGALINLGSVASDNALPLLGMYSASKHAIRGFTDALRMELERSQAPVSVTLIKPTSINTPFPQHAKNYTDREPQVPPPVYEPESVARAILHAAVKPVRDVYVGGSGRVMSALGSRAPRVMDWLGENVFADQELRDEPPRDPEGALYYRGRDGHVHGDHPGHVRKTSLYTAASLHPLAATVAAVSTIAIGAAAAAWLTSDE